MDTPALIEVPDDATLDDVPRLLAASGVAALGPAVVVVGGASGLIASDAARCKQIFARALIPALAATGATVIDGGTDVGVTRILGRLRKRGDRGRYVGVVARGTVEWPGQPGPAGAPRLEPNHTHIVGVPGSDWGDEVPWLSTVADAIAGSAASITILANGGKIAYEDVRASLRAGRRVFVLGGTGRTADEIVRAVATDSADPKTLDLVRSPMLRVLPDDPSDVRIAIEAALID